MYLLFVLFMFVVYFFGEYFFVVLHEHMFPEIRKDAVGNTHVFKGS